MPPIIFSIRSRMGAGMASICACIWAIWALAFFIVSWISARVISDHCFFLWSTLTIFPLAYSMMVSCSPSLDRIRSLEKYCVEVPVSALARWS